MTRQEALEIARVNRDGYMQADYQQMFRNGPQFDAYELFGYRHGWFTVGAFSFHPEEITGKRDQGQGNWEWL